MKPRLLISKKIKYEPGNFDNFIKLNANERSNKNLINVMSDIEFNRYPDNDCKDLISKLSDYLFMDKLNITVGNGSSELIELLLKSYIDPGDKVLSFTPSFVMYKSFTEIYNGKFIEVESLDGYVFDIDKMILSWEKNKPKIIFICNPNNPTGYLISKSEIERLLKNVDALVVVDEAYIEFSEGSMINRINEYKNLVVLRTFSKAWGLAGARLGYMISNEEIINTINLVKSPYSLNKVTQIIGIETLKLKDELYAFVSEVISEREFMYKELINSNIKVYKSNANFLYFKEDINLFDKLIKKNILIRTFNNGFYRVTIGSENENLAFLKSIKEIKEGISYE